MMSPFRSTQLMLALAVAAFVATAVPASAQKPVTQGASVSESFTITAIDYKSRLVTLRDAKGESDTMYCGPEVTRFDKLKVGDKVTFRYYESMVYAIQKPGSAKPASETGGLVRTPGAKPGGTLSQQMTATVTVNAIDTKVPSVTITAADGAKMSFKVENPKNLEGVKVGDKVDITYTQALVVSVE